MKITLLLPFVFLCAEAVARKVPGEITFKNGEVVDVTFNIPLDFLFAEPDYIAMQFRIVYFDEEDNKMILRPAQAQKIRFSYNDHEVVMLSRPNTLRRGGLMWTDTSFIFLRLQVDGRVRLFYHYYTETSPGVPSAGAWGAGFSYTVETFALERDEGELFQPRNLNFREDMSEYFEDCPELQRRIEERDLKRIHIEVIVIAYNKKCGE